MFGEAADHVQVSSTQAYYGHALGASGAFEAAISALAIQHDWIPPTVNLQAPDDACDLDHVAGGGRAHRAAAVLSNSFGFGGINASLVIARHG